MELLVGVVLLLVGGLLVVTETVSVPVWVVVVGAVLGVALVVVGLQRSNRNVL